MCALPNHQGEWDFSEIDAALNLNVTPKIEPILSEEPKYNKQQPIVTNNNPLMSVVPVYTFLLFTWKLPWGQLTNWMRTKAIILKKEF